MYNHCCVVNCTSRRKNVSLHSFPRTERVLQKWLHCIGANSDLLLGLSVVAIRKLFVCRKHFEKKFITDKQRLHMDAYPSLFTDSEITTGVPQKIYFDTEKFPSTRQTDHSYSIRKRHYDHNYCKEKPSTLDKSDGLTQEKELYRDSSPIEEEPPEEGPPEPEELIYSWQRDVDYCSPLEKPDEDQPLEEELIYSWQKDADDGSSMEEPLQEECIYSWQKHDAVVPCDADIIIEKAERRRSPSVPRHITTESAHLHVQCNVCEKEISGFRYVCVQCPDYDLCSACEARRAHSAHYVLRVPGPRPESELQQVLRTIRQALAASILQLDNEAPVEVKEEVEDPLVETPGAPYQPAGAPEDPPEHCSTANELQTHRPDAQLRTDDEGGTSSDSQDDELDYSCLYEDSDSEELTQSQIKAMQILDDRAPITKRIITRQQRRAEKRLHPWSEEPAANTRVWYSAPSPPALMQPGTEPKQLLRVFDPLGPTSPGPLSSRSLLRPSSPEPLQPELSPPETETEQLLRVFNPFGDPIQLREAYVPLQPLQLPPSASNKYFIEKL